MAQCRRAGVTSGCDITGRLKGCFALVWIEVGNTQRNCLGGDEKKKKKKMGKKRKSAPLCSRRLITDTFQNNAK